MIFFTLLYIANYRTFFLMMMHIFEQRGNCHDDTKAELRCSDIYWRVLQLLP